MAELYGANAAKVANQQGIKISKGETNGRVRQLYDKHTFLGNVNAVNDTIVMGALLPQGARVIGGLVKGSSTGTTGIYKLGHLASADGSIVADDDAFGVNLDAGGQPFALALAGDGILKRFDKPVQVVLTITEATDTAIGDTVEVSLLYVVD